jgi:hypothetical protein
LLRNSDIVGLALPFDLGLLTLDVALIARVRHHTLNFARMIAAPKPHYNFAHLDVWPSRQRREILTALTNCRGQAIGDINKTLAS